MSRKRRWTHKHLPPCETCGKLLIRVSTRRWSVVIHDDGSICRHKVKPTPPVFDPEQVLAMLINGVDTR